MEAHYFLFFKFDFMLYILGPKGTGTWFFTNEFAAKIVISTVRKLLYRFSPDFSSL